MTEPRRAERRPLDLDVFIAASPPTVWQFWVDPERMCEWWGTKAELDPHPGGIYRVTMGDDGPVMSGAYVELEPYTRLVFLFGWEDGRHGIPPSSTRVEVTLTAEGHGTRLILRHRELPTTDAVDRHHEGWAHFLAELTRAASGPADRHGDASPESRA